MHRFPGTLSRFQARCELFVPIHLAPRRRQLTVEFVWHTCAVAKAGTQVIIPYRDEDEKRHLKVTGDLGQIVSMVCFFVSGFLFIIIVIAIL